MNKIDYSIVDPILQKNPEISWVEFKALCKRKKIKCTNWSFNARKKKLANKKGYHYKKTLSPKASPKTIDIVSFVENYVPKSDRKKDYENVTRLIIANPNLSYSELLKKGKPPFSDASYYQLRRAVRHRLNKLVESRPKGKKQFTKNLSKKQIKGSSRKQAGMFVNIFEKELNGKGIGVEAKTLLEEFIQVLNEEKIANLQIVEIVFPKRVLEIRSFAKV